VSLVKLAKRWKVKTLNSLTDRLETYLDRETQKLRSKGKDSAAGALEDKVECLRTLIAKCQSEGKHSLKDLEVLILGMFSDGNNNPNPNLVTLCSSHKSKGLEWDRVFLLGRADFMPSPWATKEWMKVQESNLVYVSLTRAKRDLVEVTGVKDFLKSGE
jgi:superfamily I DNA/RNA helicase